MTTDDGYRQIEYLDLLNFLRAVDSLFPIPISQKTDLQEYSKKLLQYADIIPYRRDNMLCGVIAGYITHSKDEMAYVSFVAVLAHDQGMGIGTQLVRSFISKAEKERKKGVHLYAVQNNEAAMTMYKTLGFQEYKEKEEQRPNDVHLVYWLE